MDCFRIKSLEMLMKESEHSGHGEQKKLKRVLTATQLTALGVGAVVGAGIFVLTGQVAAQYTGPGIIFSFMLAALACVFSGLCYAEFASLIPVAGSAYTYVYATMGEIMAWTIGWSLILEYLFAGASVAVGWSGYVVSFLKDWGILVPPQWCWATGTKLIQLADTHQWVPYTTDLINELMTRGVAVDTLPQITAILNMPAILINVLISLLLLVGIKQSAVFNNIIVILKVTAIMLFFLFGWHYVNTDNWFPLIPANTGEFGHFGYSGILRGAGVIFYAYIGFDAISTLGQEAKNPQRDMPISILGSLVICTLLYIVIALTLTGIVKYTHLMVPDPMAVAVDTAGEGLRWLRPIIKIGAIAGLSSVVLVMLMGQTRVFYAISKDGLLPPLFSKVHSTFRTPYLSIIITGGFSAFFSGILSLNILGELVSIGTLLAFFIVCVGILVLRYKMPHMVAPFRTPFVPWIPLAGASISLLQMASLPLLTWVRLVIWLLIGYAIYFFYGRHNSSLNKK